MFFLIYGYSIVIQKIHLFVNLIGLIISLIIVINQYIYEVIFRRYCGSKLFNMIESITDVEHVLTQTEEFISNKKILKVLQNDSNFILDKPFKMRFSKWLQFFNDRYHTNYCE